MKNIKKSFNGVSVLKGVNLTLEKSSVHALMGENGAGKSTLMNILCGIHKCDEGEIMVNDSHVDINSPFEAQNSGIAMIHQELSPIPELTVAENIFFGREYCKGRFVDYDAMFSKTKEILNNLHINIDPKAKMKNLKVADQQLIEIAKVVSRNAEIIVMDEPTSAITDKDVDNLFEIIENLKKGRKGNYLHFPQD